LTAGETEMEKMMSDTGKPGIFYKYMTLERFLGSFDEYLAGKVYFSTLRQLRKEVR
jgi:hypothetical protein